MVEYVQQKIRGVVSKEKRRFKDDGFDLDLSYVTPRVIAMGWPARGLESVFRNPAAEVQRLLTNRHRNHYKVYNLVSEHEPDFDLFPEIEYFPFGDHNPCPLDLLPLLCQSIHTYLGADPANVVAIHCKAGKGRTGLAIAAYLLHCGICEDAEKALATFAEGRTKDRQGVTIPSQIRYVHYYSHLLRQGLAMPAPTCRITRVALMSVPTFSFTSGGCHPYFKVKVWQGHGMSRRLVTYYSYRKRAAVQHFKPEDHMVELDCSEHGLVVRGDVKLVLCHAGLRGKPTEMCSMWFNTRFSNSRDMLIFDKNVIDGANKDAKCTNFAHAFEVRVSLHHVADVSEDFEAAVSETVGSEISVDDTMTGKDSGMAWASSLESRKESDDGMDTTRTVDHTTFDTSGSAPVRGMTRCQSHGPTSSRAMAHPIQQGADAGVLAMPPRVFRLKRSPST